MLMLFTKLLEKNYVVPSQDSTPSLGVITFLPSLVKCQIRPWKILQDNEDIQDAFCKLHTSYEDEVTLSTIEEFGQTVR